MSASNLTAVEAINQSKLADWSRTGSDPERSAAADTCARIGRALATEADELDRWSADRGLDLRIEQPDGPRQRHTLQATTTSHDSAIAAAAALHDIGFERWETWTGGAGESFRHTAHEVTVARAGDASLVVRITWGDPAPSGLVGRLFRPSAGDWSMVSLPTPLWWAYSLVRPIRQVLERLRIRDPHEATLGPFLLTPRSLFAPLFDLVGLDADDVLLDIGCGDGQLVQAAAEHAGCRAIGVEHDAALVERGQRRIAATASDDDQGRIELRHGDARVADLSAVTVAFMFLPMHTAVRLLGPTLAELPPGARLIIHEQTPLPASLTPRPASSTALIASDAATVAHLWTTPSSSPPSRHQRYQLRSWKSSW